MDKEHASDYLDPPEEDDPNATYEVVDTGERKQTSHQQDIQVLLAAQQHLLQAKTLLDQSAYPLVKKGTASDE